MLGCVIPARLPSIRSATDAYDATNNPAGNLLGTLGQFAGSGGTAGSSPVPSGVVPDGWSDSVSGSPSAWASITLTEPTNASPVARPDVPGNFMSVSYSTAGASGSLRKFTAARTTQLPANKKFFVQATARIRDASFLKSFQISLLFLSASGRHAASYCMFNTGSAPASTGSAFSDSGVMYFESEPVSPPSDFIGEWRVVVTTECGPGGSAKIDMADFGVYPAS